MNDSKEKNLQKIHTEEADVEREAAMAALQNELSIRRIGVLTSGGDAPGMNGLIRSVTRTALYYGLEVMGVRRGYHGLLKGDLIPLEARDVSGLLQRGGTFLMTARSESFPSEEGLKKAAQICDVFNLDAVFCIGGDGTYRGAAALSRMGIPVMALPATIDNDIASTEYSIGYDTAMNTAVDAIDKLRDTASAHERCSVVEVMGRHNGYLALNVGIAVGAEIILIPEHHRDILDYVVHKILCARNRGKTNFIVIVAEGAAHAHEVAASIEEATGIESRSTTLGYIQRGGNPSARDRLMASFMGLHAVKALLEGRKNRAIIYDHGMTGDIDLEEAISMQKTISETRYDMSDILSY